MSLPSVPISTVLLIDPPGYGHGAVFHDLADALVHALRDLGSPARLVRGLPEQSDAETLVLGTNLLAADTRLADRLHRDAILYNLEQIEPGSPWCGPGLVGLLARHRVVDYSRQNIARLGELGLHDIGLLEVGHHPVLERIDHDPDQPIDVLFYGSLNERRSEILHALDRRGMRVHHAFGVYGAARDALIAKSKVVLNLHHFEAKVFEIVRVSYLLANGCLVVSETGGDAELEAPYREALAFADYDELVDVCERFVGNAAARSAVAARGREIMRARPQAPMLHHAFAELRSGVGV